MEYGGRSIPAGSNPRSFNSFADTFVLPLHCSSPPINPYIHTLSSIGCSFKWTVNWGSPALPNPPFITWVEDQLEAGAV